MEARSVSRFIRVSPRKARLVADLIRGKSVDEAMGILALTQKKASPILRKVVLSASANVQFMNDGQVGVVTLARDFIKQVMNRLPKEMKPQGAQNFETGDIVALKEVLPDDELMMMTLRPAFW